MQRPDFLQQARKAVYSEESIESVLSDINILERSDNASFKLPGVVKLMMKSLKV